VGLDDLSLGPFGDYFNEAKARDILCYASISNAVLSLGAGAFADATPQLQKQAYNNLGPVGGPVNTDVLFDDFHLPVPNSLTSIALSQMAAWDYFLGAVNTGNANGIAIQMTIDQIRGGGTRPPLICISNEVPVAVYKNTTAIKVSGFRRPTGAPKTEQS
jgi:hypothetical protein